MVHVDVDVGHPGGPLAEQPADRDRQVVVHAEPARAVEHGVMQAAGDARAVLRLGPSRRPARPPGWPRRPARTHRACQRTPDCRRCPGRSGPGRPARGSQVSRGPGNLPSRPRAGPRRCSAGCAPSGDPHQWRAMGVPPSPRAGRTGRTHGPARWPARPAPAPSDGRLRSHTSRAGHPRQRAANSSYITQARRTAIGNAAALPCCAARRRPGGAGRGARLVEWTAGHVDDLAGNEARVLADEEGDSGRHVGRLADPSDRNLLRVGRHEVLERHLQ